jgi:hypothetical protein
VLTVGEIGHKQEIDDKCEFLNMCPFNRDASNERACKF